MDFAAATTPGENRRRQRPGRARAAADDATAEWVHAGGGPDDFDVFDDDGDVVGAKIAVRMVAPAAMVFFFWGSGKWGGRGRLREDVEAGNASKGRPTPGSLGNRRRQRSAAVGGRQSATFGGDSRRQAVAGSLVICGQCLPGNGNDGLESFRPTLTTVKRESRWIRRSQRLTSINQVERGVTERIERVEKDDGRPSSACHRCSASRLERSKQSQELPLAHTKRAAAVSTVRMDGNGARTPTSPSPLTSTTPKTDLDANRILPPLPHSPPLTSSPRPAPIRGPWRPDACASVRPRRAR